MKRLFTALLAASLLVSLPAIAQDTPNALDAVASGEGASREAALTSALRHAIEQVLGTTVSTRTYVTNLKQIEDRVLTQASGYIQSYEVADEVRTPQGGYRVTVVAKVAQEKLKTDMAPIVGSTVALDGKTALANFQVQQASQIELERELEGWLDRLASEGIVVKASHRIEPLFNDPSKVSLVFYRIEASVDPGFYEGYREFHARLRKSSHGEAVFKLAVQFADAEAHRHDRNGYHLEYLDSQSKIVFRDVGSTVYGGTAAWAGGYFNIRTHLLEQLTRQELPFEPPTRVYRTTHVVSKKVLERTASVRFNLREFTHTLRNAQR